ncbi:unnamed protein product [Onchocerca ochengi]|uniref:CARMIL_C domain-containing protein n=1 Tax=Onchocerca ochengi TaxID=42157 RepID=A0A182E494_ONCOC|nr:unnamed protein product [Onchocerca ochengi]
MDDCATKTSLFLSMDSIVQFNSVQLIRMYLHTEKAENTHKKLKNKSSMIFIEKDDDNDNDNDNNHCIMIMSRETAFINNTPHSSYLRGKGKGRKKKKSKIVIK